MLREALWDLSFSYGDGEANTHEIAVSVETRISPDTLSRVEPAFLVSGVTLGDGKTGSVLRENPALSWGQKKEEGHMLYRKLRFASCMAGVTI